MVVSGSRQQWEFGFLSSMRACDTAIIRLITLDQYYNLAVPSLFHSLVRTILAQREFWSTCAVYRFYGPMSPTTTNAHKTPRTSWGINRGEHDRRPASCGTNTTQLSQSPYPRGPPSATGG